MRGGESNSIAEHSDLADAKNKIIGSFLSPKAVACINGPDIIMIGI